MHIDSWALHFLFDILQCRIAICENLALWVKGKGEYFSLTPRMPLSYFHICPMSTCQRKKGGLKLLFVGWPRDFEAITKTQGYLGE